jgi:hypothetical protein
VASGRIAIVGTKVFKISPLSIVRSNRLARLNIELGISPLCLQIYFCINRWVPWPPPSRGQFGSGLDLSYGYDQAQFYIVRAFLYFLGLRISEYIFWYFVLSSWYGTFSLVAL